MVDFKRKLDASIDQRLRTDPVIWLHSTRPDGRPHVVPVWFLWDGATILIFSLPNTQKLRNLQHCPTVMLALDSANQGNDIIMLEGRAVLVDDPNVQAMLPAFADKYRSLRSLTAEAWAAMFSQAIRVTPSRFNCWSK